MLSLEDILLMPASTFLVFKGFFAVHHVPQYLKRILSWAGLAVKQFGLLLSKKETIQLNTFVLHLFSVIIWFTTKVAFSQWISALVTCYNMASISCNSTENRNCRFIKVAYFTVNWRNSSHLFSHFLSCAMFVNANNEGIVCTLFGSFSIVWNLWKFTI